MDVPFPGWTGVVAPRRRCQGGVHHRPACRNAGLGGDLTLATTPAAGKALPLILSDGRPENPTGFPRIIPPGRLPSLREGRKTGRLPLEKVVGRAGPRRYNHPDISWKPLSGGKAVWRFHR